MKRILLAVACVVVSLALAGCEGSSPGSVDEGGVLGDAEAYVEPSEGLSFRMMDVGMTVTGCSGDDSVLVIPSEVDGVPVVAIGKEAFAAKHSMEGLLISEGVVYIESKAFLHCANMQEMSLPSTLYSIGDGAFENCRSLKAVSVPEGVVSVGIGAFRGCESLESVSLPSTLFSIGEGAFAGLSGSSVIICATEEQYDLLKDNAIYINPGKTEVRLA